MYNGITENTADNLQLNAGVLCKSFDKSNKQVTGIISATKGGGSFTAVPTVRGIEADGLPSNTKDFKVIDEWVATLNTTLIETTLENIKLSLGGGAKISTDTITATHTIADSDYQDLWWVGDTKDGGTIAIHLKNALNTGGFNLTIVNKGEGSFTLSAVANYDISNLNEAPFEIVRVA